MTVLYVVLSLPRAISRLWSLFRWKESIGADHEKLRVKFIGFGLTAEYPATLKLFPKLAGYADTRIRGYVR